MSVEITIIRQRLTDCFFANTGTQRDRTVYFDIGACALTKYCPLTSESAHIYPSTLSDPRSREVDLFWKALRWFWTKERVDAWWDGIRDADGIDRVENMICLSPSAHAMHIKGFFALEPIDRD